MPFYDFMYVTYFFSLTSSSSGISSNIARNRSFEGLSDDDDDDADEGGVVVVVVLAGFVNLPA